MARLPVPLRNAVDEERGVDRLADPDERHRLALAVLVPQQERVGLPVGRLAREDDRACQDLAVGGDASAEADLDAEPVVAETVRVARAGARAEAAALGRRDPERQGRVGRHARVQDLDGPACLDMGPELGTVPLGERLHDLLRRRPAAVEEPDDLPAEAGRRRDDHHGTRHDGSDGNRHPPPVSLLGPRARDDLGPALVVDCVRERCEACRQLALGHRTAPSVSSTARSCACACARAAATVPSLTSQAAAISAYEKSPKYRKKTISRRRGGSVRRAAASSGSRSGSSSCGSSEAGGGQARRRCSSATRNAIFQTYAARWASPRSRAGAASARANASCTASRADSRLPVTVARALRNETYRVSYRASSSLAAPSMATGERRERPGIFSSRADDLDDPAPVALTVELQEHHALPRPAAELAVAHGARFASGPEQHRHAVRVPV